MIVSDILRINADCFDDYIVFTSSITDYKTITIDSLKNIDFHFNSYEDILNSEVLNWRIIRLSIYKNYFNHLIDNFDHAYLDHLIDDIGEDPWILIIVISDQINIGVCYEK